MTAPDAVLFDLDGVLVDSRHAFACSVNAALASVGHPTHPPEALHRFVGPPLHETFEGLLGPDADAAAVDAVVEAYRNRYREMSAVESTVFDGIPEALAELAATRPLVVATSKTQALAEPLLDALGLLEYFEGVAGPSLTARHEPKRETMVRALALLPAGCERPVMVGDRRYDVEASHAHGMPCIGVLWGIGGEAELRDAGATVLAAAPSELPGLIASGFEPASAAARR